MILEMYYFLCNLTLKNEQRDNVQFESCHTEFIFPNKTLFSEKGTLFEGRKKKIEIKKGKNPELHPPTRTFNLIKQPPQDCSTVAQVPQGQDSSS